MKFQITQKQIDYCKINKHLGALKCPAALAIRKVVNPTKVYVKNYEFCSICGIDYEFPDNLSKFIRDFDNERPVQPIKFELKFDNYKTNIQITQEHISKGIRCSNQSCPAALAIFDEVGEIFGGWKIHVSACIINCSIGAHLYKSPDNLKKFFRDFSVGCVKPMEFELTEREI